MRTCFSNGVNVFHAFGGTYRVRGSYPGCPGRTPSLSRTSARNSNGSSLLFLSSFCCCCRCSAAVKKMLLLPRLEPDFFFSGGRSLRAGAPSWTSSSPSDVSVCAYIDRREDARDDEADVREGAREDAGTSSSASSSSSTSSGTMKSSSSSTLEFRPVFPIR